MFFAKKSPFLGVLLKKTKIIFTFFKNNSNMLILFGIYISSEYREKGFCRNILYYLIDSAKKYNFKYFCVQSVLSKILYEYLLRFKYNNKGFNLKKIGFVYMI